MLCFGAAPILGEPYLSPDCDKEVSSWIFLTEQARAFEPVAEAAVRSLAGDLAVALGPDEVQPMDCVHRSRDEAAGGAQAQRSPR